ncbi:MAG: citrate/2-methylcitrate synthase, partial [Terriglobales bacterium]
TAATLSDMHSAVTSALGALKGPLHGGANERVIQLLLKIGDADPLITIRQLISEHKKISGFGHRVYRTEDPRATHLRRMSEELGQRNGNNRLFEVSRRIEEYMRTEKGLNANVDFYSASMYYDLGIPVDLYTPIFSMARMAGWTAHILEQYADNRLIRPRAEYTGSKVPQTYVPLDQRA